MSEEQNEKEETNEQETAQKSRKEKRKQKVQQETTVSTVAPSDKIDESIGTEEVKEQTTYGLEEEMKAVARGEIPAPEDAASPSKEPKVITRQDLVAQSGTTRQEMARKSGKTRNQADFDKTLYQRLGRKIKPDASK